MTESHGECYNYHRHLVAVAGDECNLGGCTEWRKCKRRVGWRDCCTPGETLNCRLKLVAAPAVSQSEPDSGEHHLLMVVISRFAPNLGE